MVEGNDIPLSNRQTVITVDASFVPELKRFFDLLRAHDSDKLPEIERVGERWYKGVRP